MTSQGRAGLAEPDRSVLAYAEKLAGSPWAVIEGDVRALRSKGMSDEGILHVAQIVAYFSFVNRLAQGLGVELEDEMRDSA